MNVQLSGERPPPRCGAAVETIDQHRGLLHGGYDSGVTYFRDAFLIDLREKVSSNYYMFGNNYKLQQKWICIGFFPNPSARSGHRICRISKKEFERRNCFLLFGGYDHISQLSDYAYILDFDKRKSYLVQS